MGSRFTRNIHNIRKIDNQEFRTNVQNDLLSDTAGEVYVRTKEKEKPQYYQLTNAVKSVNGVATTDRAGAVTIDVGVKTINGEKPDEKGNINISGGNSILPTTIDYTTTNYKYEFYFEGEGLGTKYELTYRKFSTAVAKKMDIIQENDNDCTWGFEAYAEGNYDIDMYEIESGERVYHTVLTVNKEILQPFKIQVSKDSKNLQIWFNGDLSNRSHFAMIYSGLNPETDAPLPLVGQYQSTINQTMFLATVPDNYNTMLYVSLYDMRFEPDGYVAWTGTVIPPTMLP